MLSASQCHCEICRKLISELDYMQLPASSSKEKFCRIQRLVVIYYRASGILFQDCLQPKARCLGNDLSTNAAIVACSTFLTARLSYQGYSENADFDQLFKIIDPVKKKSGVFSTIGNVLEAFVCLFSSLQTISLSIDQKALAEEDTIYTSFLNSCDKVMGPSIVGFSEKLKSAISENGSAFQIPGVCKYDQCFNNFITCWIKVFNINNVPATSSPITVPNARGSISPTPSTVSTPPSPALRSAISHESGLNGSLFDGLASSKLYPSTESGLNRSTEHHDSDKFSLSSTSSQRSDDTQLIQIADDATLAAVKQIKIDKTQVVCEQIMSGIIKFTETLREQTRLYNSKEIGDIFHQYETQIKTILKGDYANTSLSPFIDQLINLIMPDFDSEYYLTPTVKSALINCDQKRILGKNNNGWKKNKEYFALLLALLEMLYEASTEVARVQNNMAANLIRTTHEGLVCTLDQNGTITVHNMSEPTPSVEQKYRAMLQLQAMIENKLFGYRLKIKEYASIVKETQKYEKSLLNCGKAISDLAKKLLTFNEQYNAEVKKGFFSRDRARIALLEKEIKQAQEAQQQYLLEHKIVIEVFSSVKSKLLSCFLIDASDTCAALEQEMNIINSRMKVFYIADSKVEQALERLQSANPTLANINIQAIDAETIISPVQESANINPALGAALQRLKSAIESYSHTLSPVERRRLSQSDFIGLLNNQSPMPQMPSIREQIENIEQIKARCVLELESMMRNKNSDEHGLAITFNDWDRNDGMAYILNNVKFENVNNIEVFRNWLKHNTPESHRGMLNLIHDFANQNCWVNPIKFLHNSYTIAGFIFAYDPSIPGSQNCEDSLVIRTLSDSSLIVNAVRYFNHYMDVMGSKDIILATPIKMDITFTIERKNSCIKVSNFGFSMSPSPEIQGLPALVPTMLKRLKNSGYFAVITDTTAADHLDPA